MEQGSKKYKEVTLRIIIQSWAQRRYSFESSGGATVFSSGATFFSSGYASCCHVIFLLRIFVTIEFIVSKLIFTIFSKLSFELFISIIIKVYGNFYQCLSYFCNISFVCIPCFLADMALC